MKCYREQPQAASHIYRSVLLSSRNRRDSAGSENGSPSPSEDKEMIRSSSALPVPTPNSQPPTPTRMSGTGSHFEFGEERGDLIRFYNQVYVPEVKEYIISFQQTVSRVGKWNKRVRLTILFSTERVTDSITTATSGSQPAVTIPSRVTEAFSFCVSAQSNQLSTVTAQTNFLLLHAESG